MGFSLEEIRADVDAYLKDQVFPGQPVHIQSVEDDEILEHDAAGKVLPYIAYQLGDIQQWGSKSFVGPMSDDYVWPLYIKIVVASTPQGKDIGAQLYSRCLQRFLGVSFPWAGQVRKRAGGSMFPLVKSPGSTSAVVFPASFGLLIQLAEIEESS